MNTYYYGQCGRWAGRAGLGTALLLGSLLPGRAQAQAPNWSLATTLTYASATSITETNSLVADASGNLLVAGSFMGAVAFGGTTLTSQGGRDMFLAKYVPGTGTWAWAVRMGGLANDYGATIALSGNRIYLTGIITNNAANTNNVQFGGAATASGLAPQAGAASGSETQDIVVAKYTDTGTAATLGWTQVAGGTADEGGYHIAASGTAVYVTGIFTNNAANANQVVFGGSGTTPGTLPQPGASPAISSDAFLAKYVDNGSSATVAWTQVAGGTGDDAASSVAVNGPNVYLTGYLTNSAANAKGVVFGGSGLVPGTVAQYGASATSSRDLFLAKYVDQGSSATVAWTQVAGGTSGDLGYQLAVAGSTLYVAGTTINNAANDSQVVFGGSGIRPGTVPQPGVATNGIWPAFTLAKYTDLGGSAAFEWAQVGGGNSVSIANALAVSGTTVYVGGSIFNNTADASQVLFGGGGSVPGTVTQPGASATSSYDIVVAQYEDAGPVASLSWTQVGGSAISDAPTALAVSGNRLYVLGNIGSPATFSGLTVTHPAGQNGFFLGALPVATALAAVPATAMAALRLYPNPAPGPATLGGAAPGAAVGVFDALGRRVATALADASGTAALPGGLPAGLYLVRVGAGTVRWVVE